jgi:hypothetical protein
MKSLNAYDVAGILQRARPAYWQRGALDDASEADASSLDMWGGLMHDIADLLDDKDKKTFIAYCER